MEDEAKVDEFLRHFWISRRGDVKARSLYREIKNTMEAESLNPLDITRELERAVGIYKDIVAARDEDPDIQGALRDVRDLGAKVLLPAILTLFETAPEVGDKKKMLNALITTFVRHNVIGNLENSLLETTIYTIAKDVRSVISIEEGVTRLKAFAPDNERFLDDLKAAQIRRGATARYILREIEKRRRTTEELEVQRLPSKVNLEHIYPKKPEQTLRIEEHDSLVHRLGNLTLLARPLNQSMKNGPFENKKQKFVESGLLIAREVAEYNQWTQQEIEERQSRLSREAIAIWTFD